MAKELDKTAKAVTKRRPKGRSIGQQTIRRPWASIGIARQLLNGTKYQTTTLYQQAVDGQTVCWLEPSVRTAQKLSHFAALAWGVL